MCLLMIVYEIDTHDQSRESVINLGKIIEEAEMVTL